MNPVHKRIAAVVVSVMIVIKIITLPVSASAAVGPALTAAGEAALAAILGAALVSTGFVEASALSSMSNSEILEASQKLFSLYSITDLAFLSNARDFLDESLLANVSLATNIVDWIKSHESDIIPTSTTDLKGFGACRIAYTSSGDISYICYCDYILVYDDGMNCDLMDIKRQEYYTNGKLSSEVNRSEPGLMQQYQYVKTTYGAYAILLGDVRYSDGTQYDTGEETELVIGETEDGTKVTPDMLNPDGTATVDGVDMPVNVDWEKFDPASLWELVESLVDLWTDSTSRTDSSDLADSVVDSVGDVVLDIEGLEGLTIPTSIVHVFPFCLPFDFVQGMYLFEASAEVPHFESELDFTNLMGYDLGKHKIEIDFKRFETLAKISRWLSLVLFVYSLILITPKIVKGAGT